MNTPAYERNDRPVSRADFYAIACDPQRSVAVEACAGAGKTWMLVSRILRALLAGAAPHEILAITFTRKAAGEMRQRLTEWLLAFAQATPEQLEIELRNRGLDAAEAQRLREPLRQLYATLLQSDRPVQIRTFHGWFASLLRAAPVSALETLGLPMAYELLEDDAQAVAQVWRPFWAQLLQDAALREDYDALVAAYGRFQTERALAAALQRRTEFELADQADVVLAGVPHFHALFPDLAQVTEPLALLCQPGPLRDQLQQAARLLGRASQPSFSAKGGELEQALSANEVSGVLEALLTKDGKERKFSEKLVGIEEIRLAQAAVQQVLAADTQHRAWRYQQCMTRLTRVLVNVYAALKRERGWVDMGDVERAALHLLADPVLSGWVQERLDAQTRHLLIDEFQDTNPLQWQALHAWLSAYAGSGGGAEAPRLFIVGDPKQSIYRFRRAEPQVFVAAKQFVRDLGGDLLSCDHTRRNAPEVLTLVNQALGAAQEAGDYAGFRAHTTESTEQGLTGFLPQIPRPARKARADDAADTPTPADWRDSLTTPRTTAEETLRTLECRQAAQWLAQQIAAGLPPKEIMVLARKRDRLTAMQEALRALGIAAQQPEKTDLGEVPEVQDVVALIDALVSPGHDLALARALKSPLFGVPDDDLVQLALQQRATGQSWLNVLCQGEGDAWLSDGRPIGATLLRWQQWLQTLPPHDALHAIYDDGDVLARFVAAAPDTLRASVLANLQALLMAALQVDGGRYATPYALVRALRAGGVMAPQLAVTDAVRLLTVHGAKGLEAELVLLLDIDPPAQRASSMDVLLDWPGEARAPRSFIFLASESDVPPSVQEALKVEQQARLREELNALYVALTRARQRLVLSSVQPHQAAAQSWWLRLQPGCVALSVAVEGAGAVAVSGSRRSDESAPIELPVLPLPLKQAEAVNAPGADAGGGANIGEAMPPTEVDSLESRLGQAMHRLLEWAPLRAQAGADARAADEVAPAWPDRLPQLMAEFALEEAQVQQAAAMARRILDGAGAWAWRAEEIVWHGNEVPVTWQGRVQRIDRLVRRRLVTGGHEWWVLDYKSSAQPQQQQALCEQLQCYRQAVQAFCPGEPVRAAFLTAQGTLDELVE